MLKYLFLSLTFCLFSAFNSSFAQVEFRNIDSQALWEETFSEAQQKNLLVFVDVHAEWCMPCHQMDKMTFSQTEVGDYFNRNFINVKVDGETAFGKIFAKQNYIQAYPSFLVFDQNEKLISSEQGFLDTDVLLAYGESTVKSITRLPELTAKNEKGSLSVNEKIEYAELLQARGKDTEANTVILGYLNGLPLDDLLPFREWELLKKHGADYQSPTFKKVIDNKALFIKWRGETEVQLFIESVFENGRLAILMSGTESDMKNLLDATLPHLGDDLDKENIELDIWLDFYYANKEWEKYLATIQAFEEKRSPNDFFYFEIAKNALGTGEPSLRQPALTWAEKAYSISPDLQNSAMYTYALFENQKAEEAKAMLDKMEVSFAGDEQAQQLIQSFRDEFLAPKD